MQIRTASCACGQLTAACRGEPLKVSLCHCLDCQRRTGSSYGIAAFYRPGEVEPQGRAGRFVRVADSGHAIAYRFCPDCGSTVYWEPERWPDRVAVAVGCFADPGFPPPTQEVWEERRHPWVAHRL